MNTRQSLYSLRVTTKTWTKDSHGLFDYDEREILTNQFKTSSEGFLLRSEDNFTELKPEDDLDWEPLAIVQPAEDGYQIWSCKGLDKMWIVVRSLKTQSYVISEGDLIRLGRMVLIVRKTDAGAQYTDKKHPIYSDEIRYGGFNTRTGLIDREVALPVELAEGKPSEENEDEIMTEQTCRVCYSESYTMDDPLISACSCTGSCQFIHISCLKQWLETKLTKREDEMVISYHWKSLKWELCKDLFPVSVDINGQRKEILDIPTPGSGWVVIETVPKTFTEQRSFHAISLNSKQKLSIGRGTSCDIRVSDISVSRVHATLKLKDGKLYLQDNGSKFGTLVRASRNIIIPPKDKIQVQCGRTLVTFDHKVSCFQMLSCFKLCFFRSSAAVKSESELPKGLERKDTNPNLTTIMGGDISQRAIECVTFEESKIQHDETHRTQDLNLQDLNVSDAALIQDCIDDPAVDCTEIPDQYNN